MEACTKPQVGWTCSRRAGHSGPCAAREVDPDLCPWPDFEGNPIFHGSRMWHPASGQTFTAVRLSGQSDPGDAWRALYDDDPQSVSRLALQIGDKGMAVVVKNYTNGASL